MIREFRDFLMRGNLVELAVAFVLGVAFAGVVGAFVAAFLTPLVAMVVGKEDLSSLTFVINDASFHYGSFLSALINFVATAAALFFFVVKPMNAIMARVRPAEEEPIPDEERRHQELLAAVRESRI
jgi:large conductance mechanosensitive channel